MNRIRFLQKIALAAGVSFAMTFSFFACSSDDKDNNSTSCKPASQPLSPLQCAAKAKAIAEANAICVEDAKSQNDRDGCEESHKNSQASYKCECPD